MTGGADCRLCCLKQHKALATGCVAYDGMRHFLQAVLLIRDMSSVGQVADNNRKVFTARSVAFNDRRGAYLRSVACGTTAGCDAYFHRRSIFSWVCCLQSKEKCLPQNVFLTIKGEVLPTECIA